jgi:hypothetical protein
MSSLPSIHDGTISANPFDHPSHGRVTGSLDAPVSGTLRGSNSGTIAEPGDSAESSAVAELNGLISSLASLSSQAQSLPLSTPSLPSASQTQGYRPQKTDYAQFVDDAN